MIKRDKLGRFARSTKSRGPIRPPKNFTRKKVKGNILNVFLLDDTGSMSSKVSATIEGFNSVLNDAEKAVKDTGVNSTEVLALFGEYNHFHVRSKVEPLTGITYRPARGSTALWWAVCEAINLTEQKLRNEPVGTKVILTIFTDGENNSMYEYEARARNLVLDKQKQDWVINFIGAGSRDQILQASGSIGIFANNTLNYANTSVGTRGAFASMSKSRSSFSSKVATNTATADGFFAND